MFFKFFSSASSRFVVIKRFVQFTLAVSVVERDDYIHGLEGEVEGGGEVFGSSTMACVCR